VTERQRVLLLGSISAATLTCFGWIGVCPHGAECVSAVTSADTLLSQGTRVAVALAAVSFVGWLLYVSWILSRTALDVRRLPRAPGLPPALLDAMARTGVRRVTCLAGEAATAFCAGALRPQILVSESVVRNFDGEELDAILLHEQDHARRFEPLVRAAYDAAARVFFYVPLVRWWSRRRIEDAELRADRAALDRLGRRPVAAALWALGASPSIQGTAAFGGVAERRVAQVLGDPLPRRAPEWSLLSASTMGIYLAFQVAFCLVQGAQHLL